MKQLTELLIYHTADKQINCDKGHENRTFEYESQLNKMSSDIVNGKYNLVLLVGDMFERWNAIDTERKIFTDWIHKILKLSDATIVLTDGNHDLQQSSFGYDPGDGSTVRKDNVLKTLSSAINNPRFIYHEHTGLYVVPNVKVNGLNVVTAVWSHLSKYTVNQDAVYNPWFKLNTLSEEHKAKTLATLQQSIVIDMFHDPIKDTIGWDGQILRGNNDGRVDINGFLGDMAALGDIHLPGTYKTKRNTLVSYPSSPIIRYFDEGDYYVGADIVSERNTRHGINKWTVRSKTDITLEWLPLAPYSTKHTIDVPENWTAEDAVTLKLLNVANVVDIKIRPQGAVSTDAVDALVRHLHTNYNVRSIQVQPWSMSKDLDFGVPTEKFDTDNLTKSQYILDTAKNILESRLAHMEDGDRQRSIDQLLGILDDELQIVLDTTGVLKYKFLGMGLTNFMPFTAVDIDFARMSKSNDIVKIRGNNGTGKSTILKGVSWLATGKIDHRQQDRQHKQNLLDYFNDKTVDNDEVNGWLKILRDNITWTVKRHIIRKWRKDVTDEQKHSARWRDFISSVNETVEVYENDKALPEEQGQQMLYTIFGDFYSFAQLHMVNQSTLDHLFLDTNIDNLVHNILMSVGFDCTDKLNNRKELVEQQLFKDLTIHSKNIVGVNAEIQANLTKLEEIETERTVVDANVVDITKEYDKLQLAKEQELSNKKQITPLAETFEILEKSRKDAQTAFDNTQKLIDNPQWTAEDALKLSNTVKQLEQLKETKNEQLRDFNIVSVDRDTKIPNLISGLDNARNVVKNAATARLQTQQTKLNDGITAIANEINALEATAKTNALAVIDKYNADVNTQITDKLEAQKPVSAQYNDVILPAITKLNTNISNDNAAINSTSDTCGECGQKLTNADDIAAHKQMLTERVTKAAGQLTILTTKRDELLAKINETDTAVSTLRESIIDKNTLSTLTDIVNCASKCNDLYVCEQTPYIATLNERKATYTNALTKISTQDIQYTAEEQQQFTEIDTKETEFTAQLENAKIKCNNVLSDIATTDASISTTTAELTQLQAAKTQNDVQLLHKQLYEHRQLLTDIDAKLLIATTNKANDAHNAAIDEHIVVINNSQAALSTERTRAANTLSELNIHSTTAANKNTALAAIIDDIKLADWQSHIFKTYKYLVSTKGINKLIFDRLALQLNSEMSALLDGLNFKIFFDITDGYTLKMADMLGKPSVRKLYTIGGMESTLGALALFAIIKSKTAKRNGDFIFIDEITGKLNDGKHTKSASETTNKNYQLLTKQLLDKLNQLSNITIIDHVLPDEWFTTSIDVLKDDKGRSQTTNLVI